jgi:DNA-binding beta-propeller fold protein YncE
MRRRTLLVLALAVGCAVWTVALASGAGPSPGLSSPRAGLVDGKLRYVAQPAGSTTEVQVLNAETSAVLRHMRVRGVWGIPLVAFDGTAEGLVPNAQRLLLAQSLFKGNTLRTTTQFRVVDTQRMKVARRIKLKGAFAFDAVSRDGRYVYLIEYMTPEDPSAYRVRAYDLRSGKLLAKIVSDKRSWATDMRGLPVTRTWKDGWAYTLYGANARPFIHALDTANVAAVCINLPWTTSPDRFFDYRLRVDGDGHLVVRGPNGRTLAVIDRQTFKVISAVSNP